MNNRKLLSDLIIIYRCIWVNRVLEYYVRFGHSRHFANSQKNVKEAQANRRVEINIRNL